MVKVSLDDGETIAGSAISSGSTYTIEHNFGHIPVTDQSGVQINSILAFTPAENYAGNSSFTISLKTSDHGEVSRTTEAFSTKWYINIKC